MWVSVILFKIYEGLERVAAFVGVLMLASDVSSIATNPSDLIPAFPEKGAQASSSQILVSPQMSEQAPQDVVVKCAELTSNVPNRSYWEPFMQHCVLSSEQ
jgi:hypothetical protein